MSLLKGAVMALGIGACAGRTPTEYAWDDSRVLCSLSVDDIKLGTDMSKFDELVDDALADDSAALAHAHQPGTSISLDGLQHILSAASDRGLEFVTYDQLVAGPAHPALALSFDDEFIEEWTGIRSLLQTYNARVTFFVTRYGQWTPEHKQMLHDLASDGHDIEAHGVNHLNAITYLDDHTAQDYATDEIAPSVEVLRADGYPVTTFAFPFSASNGELHDAALTVIDRVRTGGRGCP
jgi:hypothetical protein